MKTRFLKRGASLMVAAALLSGGMPGALPQAAVLTASADAAPDYTVSSWEDLQNAIIQAPDNTPTLIRVSDNGGMPISPFITNSPLFVRFTKIIELDLNGQTLSRELNDAVVDGCVIINEGTLTLKNGSVTGGFNENGGGGILNKGTLTLEHDVSVYGCKALGNGGGVFNTYNAVLKINGAKLEDNEAKSYGGGIFNDGTLEMSPNTPSDPYESQNPPYLSANRASKYGGGLYNAGGATAVLKGAGVEWNEAGEKGGGIYNEGTLVLDKQPAPNEYSSPLYTNISSNKAGNVGGGIYNDISSDAGIEFASFASVSNNTSYNTEPDDSDPYYDNIYIVGTAAKLKITGEFPEDITDKTGITIRNSSGSGITGRVLTDGFAANNPGKSAYDYFKADTAMSEWIVADNNNGEACFKHDLWKKIQDAIDGAVGNLKIVLSDDAVCYDRSYINIPEGANITIDLNGHNIDRNRANSTDEWVSDGYVIKNNGTLTVLDSTGNNGMITGGCSGHSYETVVGGVYNAGVFNFQSGMITGNRILGNSRGCSAVYNEEYESYDEDYNSHMTYAQFNISGGIITGNYTETDSALFAVNGANISGTPFIYDNCRTYPAEYESQWNDETQESDEIEVKPAENVQHNISGAVTVNGQLEDGAVIGVDGVTGVLTSGYYANGNTDHPGLYFKCDDDRYDVVWSSDGTEAALKPVSTAAEGASLILRENIAIELRAGLGVNDKLLFRFTWGNGKSAYSQAEVYFDEDSRSYYGTAELPMAPKDLSDTITYEAFSFDDALYNNSTYTYSVADGAQPVLSGTFNAKNDYIKPVLEDGELPDEQQRYTSYDRQMLRALVNYAKAAQVLFNYNTDDPIDQYVNDSGETVTITFTPSVNAKRFDELALSNSYAVPEDNSSDPDRVLTYYGTSMILENKPVLRHYFWVADPADPPTATIGYGYNYKQLQQFDPSSHYCYVETDSFMPEGLDYGVTVSVPVLKNGEYTFAKVTMSVYDFIYKAYRSPDTDEKTKNALMALFCYGEEANIYRYHS